MGASEQGPVVTERVVHGEEVAPGIRRFDDGFVNWYLVEAEGGLWALDAGFPPAWDELRAALEGQGRAVGDLSAIVLTHAHVDHIGFAERARREAGAVIHVHEGDVPILGSRLRVARSERSPLRYLNHAATRRLIARALATGAPTAKRASEWTSFRHGDVLDSVPGSPRVIHTPGHTDGHCLVHLAARDVLFVGDAVVTRNPYTGQTGPRIVSAAATADTRQALASLDRVAETGASLLLPGHGEPFTEGAEEAVRLARAAGAS